MKHKGLKNAKHNRVVKKGRKKHSNKCQKGILQGENIMGKRQY